MTVDTMNDTDTLPTSAVVHHLREAKASGFDQYIELLDNNFGLYIDRLRERGVPRSAVVDFIHYALHGELPERRSATKQDEETFMLRYGDDFDMHMLGLFASGLYAEGISQADLNYIVSDAYLANGAAPERKGGC